MFVIVPESDWLEPTVTLPKLREVGLDVSWPAVVAPAPESGIVSVEFEALEVTVTLPLAAPLAVGANFTVKVVL